MKYNVLVRADGVAADLVRAAALKYREVLEAELGGSTQIKLAFESHDHVLREGALAVPREVDALYEAWRLASAKAEAAAQAILGTPKSVDATVRLEFVPSWRT